VEVVTQTNEKALEACIEQRLTGISREELTTKSGEGPVVRETEPSYSVKNAVPHRFVM
jgi:hypothetical protein